MPLSLFITFEGPEGSGKTTQIKQLAAWLRAAGHEVLTTREPGGTAIGDRIRGILLDTAHGEMQPQTEILLFSAARAQHVHQVIRPHLARGGVVLCDRYADSTLAYQGYGRNLDLEQLRLITEFTTGGLQPDLTICLDVPVEVGLRRKQSDQDGEWNRLDQETASFHERVRAGYLTLARQQSARWRVIDATAPVASVQTAIRSQVATRVPVLAAQT